VKGKNMPDISEIGVLLVDNDSDTQIGFIKFDPTGILVYQIIKTGLHVFAFKPINKLLSEQWLKEPLYIKHAELLAKNPKLPNDILEKEAISCADFLNALASPLTLGGGNVKAQMVHVGSKG
jgi:hypothetical protein